MSTSEATAAGAGGGTPAGAPRPRATSPSCPRGSSAPDCSSSTRWWPRCTSRSPTTTGSRPPLTGLDNWRYVFGHYPFFWPALRNTLWLVAVMVTLRVRLRAVPRTAGHQDQARGRRSPHRALPAVPRPAGRRHHGVRLPAQPRHRPGQRRSSASSACPQPGWFNDPTWSKPALTLLALWGIGDLMVIFMAALLDVPTSAVRGGRARRSRPLAAVPLHHAAQHLARSSSSPW